MSEYIRKLDTLSYSRLSTFHSCEHLYNMQYNGMINENNEIEFPERGTTQSLSFGQIVHRGTEFALKNNKLPEFEDVVGLLNEDEQKEINNDDGKKLFYSDILPFIKSVMDYVKENDLKYIAHEYKLDVEFKPEMFEQNINLDLYKKFGGDIDLIFRKPDDNILLVDIKTAKWFYENKLKTDSFTQYQLVLYKYFYSIQENIPTSNIQQSFFVMRKDDKNNLFKVIEFTAGDKKIKNALEEIRKMVNKASKKNTFFLQNRKSCSFCALKNTKFCKGSNAMKMFLNNN